MKTIKLSIAVAVGLFFITACSPNKEAQLEKLKQQQTAINDKILKLQADMAKSGKDSLNPQKFKFVGLKDVTTDKFDHFIRVQGKIDGDQNAAVFAEAPGTVTSKFADVGQKVSKGQVLAQIDDQQYRSQMQGLESQYQLASDLYDKQKRLWDQKIGSEVQYMQAKQTRNRLKNRYLH